MWDRRRSGRRSGQPRGMRWASTCSWSRRIGAGGEGCGSPDRGYSTPYASGIAREKSCVLVGATTAFLKPMSKALRELWTDKISFWRPFRKEEAPHREEPIDAQLPRMLPRLPGSPRRLGSVGKSGQTFRTAPRSRAALEKSGRQRRQYCIRLKNRLLFRWRLRAVAMSPMPRPLGGGDALRMRH